MPIQIGYAQQIITPSLDQPVFLAGFGNNRLATSVHDDLYARALVIRDNQGRMIALAAIDSLGIPRLDCQEIHRRIQAVYPDMHSIVASTHTHHAPDPIGLWGPDRFTSGVDRGYIYMVIEKTSFAIIHAAQQMRSAEIRLASVRVPGVVKNARDPDIVDDELTCLQFISYNQSPLITLLTFPCHPEVLWEANPDITSDYPAYLRQEIEKQTGSPCIFFAGALGGMLTPDVQSHTFGEAEKMGLTLAHLALQALATQPVLQLDSLQASRREFTIPLQNPIFHTAIHGGLLPNIINQSGEVTTEANLIQIGPLWVITVPGELLPKLGLAIKAHLLKKGATLACVIGLANDELGYILPKGDFLFPLDPFNPKEHYEEIVSIGSEAGPCLMAAVNSLLESEGV